MDAVILDPRSSPSSSSHPRCSCRSSPRAVRDLRNTQFQVELSDAVERTDHVVSADPHLVVRVHRPVGVEGPLPCVYSIHGGGYVLGTYELDDARFDSWCARSPLRRGLGRVPARTGDAVPRPARRLLRRAGLDVRPRRRARHRPRPDRHRRRSAGGGLAAALALLARDRGELPLAFQLLECPMIDDRQTTCRAGSTACRSGAGNRTSSAGGPTSAPSTAPTTSRAYAAAARATDLAGLPPALVIVGGADGFRDEDIDYALRLGQAGVPTELHVLPGRAARRADVHGLGGGAALGPDRDRVVGAAARPLSRVSGAGPRRARTRTAARRPRDRCCRRPRAGSPAPCGRDRRCRHPLARRPTPTAASNAAPE